MPEAFERNRLPAEAQQSLEELRELSALAKAGNGEARRELKRKLQEASPAVIARASDIGRRAQRLLIDTASVGDPLTKDALSRRLDMMREEIAGENPTPLEVLLTERVVSCWMLVELFDALIAAQLWRGSKNRGDPSYLKHLTRWQESATRRFLAAIKSLVQVRKLQGPSVQINYAEQQVNIAGDLKR